MRRDLAQSSAPMDITVVSGSLTGNRGSEAMILACVNALRESFPKAVLHIVTYRPKDDQLEPVSQEPNVFIHSCHPVQIVANWLPSIILTKMFPRLKYRARHSNAGLRGLLFSDAVIDVAGVSFIDSRKKFLIFNVLSLLPFILNRCKTYKIAQAIGPIETVVGRLSANMILPHCRKVFARGDLTYAFLQKAFPGHSVLDHASDIAFTLPTSVKKNFHERRIVFCPSSLLTKKHPAYIDNVAHFIQSMASEGVGVDLLAHSWIRSDKFANNDLPTIKAILKRIPKHVDVGVIGEGLCYKQLKEEIGRYPLAIVSRFHAMVSALSTQTPLFVVGWGHKYREVLAQFGLTDVLISTQDFLDPKVKARILQVLAEPEDMKQQICAALPSVKASARRQIDIIISDLEN